MQIAKNSLHFAFFLTPCASKQIIMEDSENTEINNPPAAGGSTGVVDIVFVLDVTGSMQPCINAVKENISTFVRTLCTPDANGGNIVRHWRAKAVGYRDHEYDGASWFIDNPFVETADVLQAQLARLRADGGGDEPESLLDALWKILVMEQSAKGAAPDPLKWRYRSAAVRVVIVFTDASFPERLTLPEALGGDTKSVIDEIHAKRVILSIFAPDIECHHNLAMAQRSDYHPIPCDSETPGARQRALAEFSRDSANFQKVMEALAKSVSKSASVPTLE
jgi:hypothetical protein